MFPAGKIGTTQSSLRIDADVLQQIIDEVADLHAPQWGDMHAEHGCEDEHQGEDREYGPSIASNELLEAMARRIAPGLRAGAN